MTLYLKLCYNLKSDISGNRYRQYRGKSMLTQSEMIVVFVLDETINQGIGDGNEIT